MKCYKCSTKHLLKQKTESRYHFAKSTLCKRLIELCNGEILINHSCQTIALRFPVKCLCENASGHTFCSHRKECGRGKDRCFIPQRYAERSSSRPVVVLADSNDDFRFYLETCLSEKYIVRRPLIMDRKHWRV